MKRNFILALLTLGLSMLFSACQKTPNPFFIIEEEDHSTFEVGSQAGSFSFSFYTNQDWLIHCSSPWIRINPSSGSGSDSEITVTIYYEENLEIYERVTGLLLLVGNPTLSDGSEGSGAYSFTFDCRDFYIHQKTANIQFEDPVFKSYCVENFDKDDDGEVSLEEATYVREIRSNGFGKNDNEKLRSLEGIQYFTNLQRLGISGNLIKSIDLSNNKKIDILQCGSNQLATLDVSNNTELQHLECDSNQLTTLDVSNNTKLYYLNCENNQITTLDVSNTNLPAWSGAQGPLKCSGNPLEKLYLKRGWAIEGINMNHSTKYIPAETEIIYVN